MEQNAITQSVRTSKATRAFCISLILLLLCSLVNWGIISSWGYVDITRVTVIGDYGLEYSGLIYVPKTATDDNPAPAIFLSHGNSGNARNHEAWALEFARRGFVVLTPDMFGGGNGEANSTDGARGSNDYNGVAYLFADYLVHMNIVDPTRFMVAGHSRGTGTGFKVGELHDAVTVVECGATGYVPTTWSGNLLAVSGTGDRAGSYEKFSGEILEAFNAYGDPVESIEPNVMYGSFEDGDAKMFAYLDGLLHEGSLVSGEAIQVILDFCMDSIGSENVPNYLPGSDQIWGWKDVVGLCGMIAFVATLLTLAVFLMEKVPAFAKIRQPMPRNIGLRGKDLALSITAALVFPLIVLYTGCFGFRALIGVNTFALFPMQQANQAFSVIVGLNFLGLLMLLLFIFAWGKRKFHAKLCDYGLTYEGKRGLDWGLIARAFLLALVVLACGFAYLQLQADVLGTELYCLFFGFKEIPWNKFIHYIPYIIIWIVCFVIASLGMNVERRLPEIGGGKYTFVVQVVFNTVLSCGMITVMVLIQIALQSSIAGTSALASWGTDLTRLWGMPFGMAAAGVGQTYLYRKSGSVWLGAFTMGILCALCCMLYGQYQTIIP